NWGVRERRRDLLGLDPSDGSSPRGRWAAFGVVRAPFRSLELDRNRARVGERIKGQRSRIGDEWSAIAAIGRGLDAPGRPVLLPSELDPDQVAAAGIRGR